MGLSSKLPFCIYATTEILMGDIHPYQVRDTPHSVSIRFKFLVFCCFVSVIKLFKCIFPLLNKKGSNNELLCLSIGQNLLLCALLLFTFWNIFVCWDPVSFPNSDLILFLLKSNERLRKIHNCAICLHKSNILQFIRTLFNWSSQWRAS